MSSIEISRKSTSEDVSSDNMTIDQSIISILQVGDDSKELNFYFKNSSEKFESVLDYSNQLSEILYILNEDKEISDEERKSVEKLLIDLIEAPPYPNQFDQLSRILIDNFQQLNKMIIKYNDLEISSLINRFLVNLIYELSYWEIYHLLYFLPRIDYYLKLTNFEIIVTPFGPLIRPPENYYSKHMMEAFKYPFPYPYYNYSYHSFKPRSSTISIVPYDIPLEAKPKKPRKPRERKEKVNPWAYPKPKQAEYGDGSPDKSKTSSIDMRRGSSVGDDNDSPNSRQYSQEYEDDGQEGEGPDGEKPTRRKYQTKPRSEVIHQCHFDDPLTHKPCLKIFYGKNELLRHQEFVHATKKKIYKCIFCARIGYKVQSYPRHDSLARHIRRKHGITGKENKKAVNYAKENVEIMEDDLMGRNFPKTIPTPHMLNSDFTINTDLAQTFRPPHFPTQEQGGVGSSSNASFNANEESEDDDDQVDDDDDQNDQDEDMEDTGGSSMNTSTFKPKGESHMHNSESGQSR